MEFTTKAALAEWANDQTMAEIAAYYNGLPDVRPDKKFESRGVGKSAMSGRKQPLERPRTRFINPVIPRHRVILSSQQDGHQANRDPCS